MISSLMWDNLGVIIYHEIRWLFQRYEKLGKRYWGWHLWARGYCVSTIGLNEQKIREYVKWQEKKEKEIEQKQLNIFK